MTLIIGAGSFSMALAALVTPRKHQISTSVSKSMNAALADGANMCGYVHEIIHVCPHAEGRVVVGVAFFFFDMLRAGGDQRGSFLSTIEDGYLLLAVEGTQHFGHASTQIENGSLHDVSPVCTWSV